MVSCRSRSSFAEPGSCREFSSHRSLCDTVNSQPHGVDRFVRYDGECDVLSASQVNAMEGQSADLHPVGASINGVEQDRNDWQNIAA